MNPDVAKSVWRGFMCTQNREQADAWYERLTEDDKAVLDATPLAIMSLARKGQETMTTYEQYRAGYISREEWAEKEIAPLMQPVRDAEAQRKMGTFGAIVLGVCVVAYVAILVVTW